MIIKKKEMNESAIKNVLSRDHKKTKRRKKTRKRRSTVPVGTRRIEAFSNRVGVREKRAADVHLSNRQCADG